jgi:hypothetical protein
MDALERSGDPAAATVLGKVPDLPEALSASCQLRKRATPAPQITFKLNPLSYGIFDYQNPSGSKFSPSILLSNGGSIEPADLLELGRISQQFITTLTRTPHRSFVHESCQ